MATEAPSTGQQPPPPSPMEQGGGPPPPPQPAPGADPHGYSAAMADRERAGAMGYRGPPPPSHGPPPPGMYDSSFPPHSSPYGHGMYGGPPPPGPPGGYHRGPPPHYGGGAYGGGYARQPPPPPHYPYGGGGYEGHYPGGGPPPRGPPPPSSYGRASPIGPAPGAPGDPSSTRPSESPPPNGKEGSPPNRDEPRRPTASPEMATSLGVPMAALNKLPNHVEVERLRAAAATEITAEEVKPIQTDFHFFAKEHMEKYRKLAEEEVRQGLEEGKPLDPILVNTNLNTRLMKAWEALTKDQRDAYMVQEEEDRRRFMEEDEIASRHCATLTARGKSPNNAKGVAAQAAVVAANAAKQLQEMRKEERQESETKPTNSLDRDLPGATNSSQPAAGADHGDEKKTEDGDDEAPKRSAPEATVKTKGDEDEDIQESPTKRNKVEEPEGEKES